MKNKISRNFICFASSFTLAFSSLIGVQMAGNKLNTVMAATVERIGEENRYATAARLAQDTYSSSKYVVIASGRQYRDAVSAAPLAKQLNAPILLTSGYTLESEIQNTIRKLGADTAYIIGGLDVISSKIENSLRFSGTDTIRIYGKNAFDTNVKIANQVLRMTGEKTAILVNGTTGYPDAVSAASIAANMGYPVLFTNSNSIPSEVKSFIKNNGMKVLAVGGSGVISNSVLSSVGGIRIAAGSDRFDTNLKLLNYFKNDLNYDNIYVACGGNDKTSQFADALAASAAASKTNSPVVLSGLGANEIQQKNAEDFIKSHKNGDTVIKIVGGVAAVSSEIENRLNGTIAVNGQVGSGSELPFDRKFFVIGNNAYSMDYFVRHKDKIDSEMKATNGIVFYCYKKDGQNIIMNTNSQYSVSEQDLNKECGNTIHYYDSYSEVTYIYNGHNYKKKDISDGTYNAKIRAEDIGNRMLIGVTLKNIVKEDIPGAKYFQVKGNPYIEYINGSNEIQCMISRDDYNEFTTIINVLNSDKEIIASGKVDLTDFYSSSGTSYRVAFNLVDDSTSNALGNIVNGGMALQHGDYLFYSNTGDGGKLYRKDIYGNFDRAISNDDARYINVYKNKVIYSSKNDNFSIKAVNYDGSDPETITDDKATYLNVVGDYIYYSNHSDNGKLYRIKIMNTDSGVKFGTPQKICDDECEYISVVGGNIYYSNYSDGHRLYSVNTDGTGRVKISSDSANFINVSKNYIYYLTDAGDIKKVGLDGNIPSDNVIARNAGALNVMGDYIYYTNSSENGYVYRICLQDNDIEKVSSTSADFINITGNFADFKDKMATISGENLYIAKNGKLYNVDLKEFAYSGVVAGKAVTRPNYTLRVSKVYEGRSIIDMDDIDRSQKYIDDKYLPKKVTALMSDDTLRELVVIWDKDNVSDSDGVRTYTGDVIGYNVKATYKLMKKSEELAKYQVKVVNNAEDHDYIIVTGLKKGDKINVYKTDDVDGEKYGSGTADSHGEVKIYLSSNALDEDGGEVYVTVISSYDDKSGSTSSESDPIKVSYEAEPPKSPSSISVTDNDSKYDGIDGRDFKVEWHDIPSEVVKQYIYILQDTDQNSEVDYARHKPIAVIYDNKTNSWVGNSSITKDSAGYEFLPGRYKVFVIFEDSEGRRSLATKCREVYIKSEGDSKKRVSSIRFEEDSILMRVGQAYIPEVIIKPSDAENKEYSLKSYNDTIVRVEGHTIRALAKGTTTVEVISNDTGAKDKITVTVE